MGMYASTFVADSGLDWVTSNVNKIMFCTTQPANKGSATGLEDDGGDGVMLAYTTDINWTGPADGTTDYLRNITLGQASEVVVRTSGGLGHIALITASTLAYVTTVQTTRNVTTADTVTMQSWLIGIGKPSTL